MKFTAEQIASLKLDSTGQLHIICDSTVNINLDQYIENEDAIDLNSMFAELKVIPLETNDSSLVGDIRQIIVTDSMIYIFDNYQGGSVILFKSNGRYVRRIERGPGPQELLGVKNIVYNFILDEFAVAHDYFLSFYNPLTGQFLRRVRMPLSGVSIMCIPDGYVIQAMNGNANWHISTDTTYQYLVTDREFRLKAKGFPYTFDEGNSFSPRIMPLHYGNNHLDFSPSFCDTIYQYIDYNHIRAKYVLRYSRRIPDAVLRDDSTDEFMKDMKSHDYYVFMGDYVLTPTHAYFMLLGYYRPYNSSMHIFWDLNSGKGMAGSSFSWDMKILPDMSDVTPIASYGDYFVAYSYPNEENSYFLTDSMLPQATVDAIKRLKEDDNPMILLYKLKPFD